MHSRASTLRWPALALFGPLVIAAALGLAACGGDGDERDVTPTVEVAATATEEAGAGEIPVLEITTTESGFSSLPDSIPGGLTRIRLHNEDAGDRSHQAQLFRLNEGATPEQVVAALDYVFVDDPESVRRVFSLVNWAGGADYVPPGGTSEVVVDLPPGSYVLLDVNLNPTPHWRTGEFHRLEVTAPPAQRPTDPVAEATITISDFQFDAPETLPAGKVTIKATNTSTRRHAMAVFSKQTPAGGLVESFPGTTGWAVLDLTPGDYVMLCGIYDVELKKSHLDLGMVHAFTVK